MINQKRRFRHSYPLRGDRPVTIRLRGGIVRTAAADVRQAVPNGRHTTKKSDGGMPPDGQIVPHSTPDETPLSVHG